jgi:hypothetical protein
MFSRYQANSWRKFADARKRGTCSGERVYWIQIGAMSGGETEFQAMSQGMKIHVSRLGRNKLTRRDQGMKNELPVGREWQRNLDTISSWEKLDKGIFQEGIYLSGKWMTHLRYVLRKVSQGVISGQESICQENGWLTLGMSWEKLGILPRVYFRRGIYSSRKWYGRHLR